MFNTICIKHASLHEMQVLFQVHLEALFLIGRSHVGRFDVILNRNGENSVL